jgi:hypothetical protein
VGLRVFLDGVLCFEMDVGVRVFLDGVLCFEMDVGVRVFLDGDREEVPFSVYISLLEMLSEDILLFLNIYIY